MNTPQATGNLYVNERTNLTCFYSRGWKVSPLNVQRDRLLTAFPNLKLPEPVFDRQTPRGFDGPAYQVFPERLGLRHDIPNGDGVNHGLLIETAVFPAVAKVCKANGFGFCNWLAGELTRQYIRLAARGREILAEMQAATRFDAFIAPLSFGQLWYPDTLSPRNARGTAFFDKNLPLGTAMNACHLIAMPDRLVSYDDLWIDNSGDEYDRDQNGAWLHCPCFGLNGGALFANARDADDPRSSLGSPVAHLGEMALGA